MFRRLRALYPTDPTREKVARRVARLSETELLAWADVTGTAIARSLRDYQLSRDPAPLQEAREAISALQAVIDSLVERSPRK
jgi:glutathione S-transferase